MDIWKKIILEIIILVIIMEIAMFFGATRGESYIIVVLAMISEQIANFQSQVLNKKK